MANTDNDWRLLLESVPDIILRLSADGEILACNHDWPEVTTGDLLGQNIFQYIAPDQQDALRELLNRVFQLGQAGSCEISGLGPIGSQFGWHEIRVVPVAANGVVESATMVASDITSKKNAERKLSESETSYKDLVEGSLQGMAILTGSPMRLVFFNPATAQLLGYEPEELRELDSLDLIHPDDRALAERNHRDRVSGKAVSQRQVVRILRKDGAVRWFDCAVRKTTYRGDYALQATFLDITSHKRAEQALRQSEEKYRLLIERSPFGVVVTDTSGRIVEVNEKTCAIAEMTREELIGSNGVVFLMPKDQETAQQILLQLQEQERLDNLEFETAAGKRVRVNSIVFDEDPKLLYATVEDYTEKHRLEHQLAQAKRMDAIGKLAGGVAHDFNNMLSVIMGLASVLRVEIGAESHLQKDIDGILSATDRGRALTRNLLGFARRGKYRKEPISLNDVAAEVAELLGRTVDKKIEIHTELDQQLPSVEGDPTQMNQVLVNIGLNAADAINNHGSLTISTSRVELTEQDLATEPDLTPGRYVRLCVRDTGAGMSAPILHRAFEPFFTTKSTGEGTGLGLSMVYGTIKNHGGTVRLDSEEGHGTTVTIDLPAIQGEPIRASTPPKPVEQPAKFTVLLVDDEDLVRSCGQRLLEMLGHEVLLAASGETAIECYRENREAIGVVILDMMMPGLDGRETYERLREIDPDVCVLPSSGHSREDLRTDAFEPGTTFVQKPYDLDQLEKALDDALSG